MFIRVKRRILTKAVFKNGPRKVFDFVLVQSVRTSSGPRLKIVKHLGTHQECHTRARVIALYHKIVRRAINSGAKVTSKLLAPVRKVAPVPPQQAEPPCLTRFYAAPTFVAARGRWRRKEARGFSRKRQGKARARRKLAKSDKKRARERDLWLLEQEAE